MSKPKNIRTCAFCGQKEHKSHFLRILLPTLKFDLLQKENSRSFYVCQNIKCISKVLKKKSVNKFIDNIDYNILYNNMIANIKLTLSYFITNLFNNGSYNENSSNITLCKNNTTSNNENIIMVSDILYNGYKTKCNIENKKIADLLLNYKNIITYIDGLNGELDGSKKS